MHKMNLSAALAGRAKEGKKTLVAYLPAGYPSLSVFKHCLETVLMEADLVEIGFPFSDPLADGITIQHAYQQALDDGFNLPALFEMLRRVSNPRKTPLVLMSYLNPLISFGIGKLAPRLRDAGFGAVLIPDLPAEEAGPARKEFNQHGIEVVQLLSPATGIERARRILRDSQGFVYLVSLRGVTGTQVVIPNDTIRYLAQIKKLSGKPVYVGFGISRPRQVAQLTRLADGIIVGSALVRLMKKPDPAGSINKLLRKLRKPMLRE